jgi:NAD(P)-dependent dehydrogenase (short-subunit alcohol dehydrogenase family)
MSFEQGLLAGKVALVAGASTGINLGIARRLGELGAKVAIFSRRREAIDEAAAQLRAEGIAVLPLVADVRHPEAVALVAAKVAQAWGPLDIVVSGAAGNFFAAAEAMSPKAFRTVIEIDLLGTFNVLHGAFPHLNPAGASLVNISAPQAQRPMRYQAHACSAKAGIDMLTKCLAVEWGDRGIRVNAVSPGPIADTEGLTRLAVNGELSERIRTALPLRSFGRRSNIADAVAFLCSDAASYITGTILDCDGGMRLGDFHTPELEAVEDAPPARAATP